MARNDPGNFEAVNDEGPVGNLRKGALEAIVRLARAAEYKDEDTGAHILRISDYAVAVGRRIGMSGDDLELLRLAAPMHDIGKVAIPDRILLKPARLTPEEWVIMRQHTVFGARFLAGSDSEFVRLAEVVAMTHHEKWDGNGYPRGLKGSATPIAGRIVGLADVFDALTTRRPYKAAFPVDRSLTILREGRERDFDPDVLDAFLSAETEIRAIRERYTEADVADLVRLAHEMPGERAEAES
jgi:putative two-component system response regulator